MASHEKIKKSTQAGSSIFSVRASDKDNDQVLYSIIGVDYYVNSTADPKSAHNASWGMKTDLQQVNKCVTDSLLPFPRNLFCIGLRNGTVYTTQAFSKINIATGSKFLLHIIIYDNAVPQRNVTTVITVEVQRQCEAALSHYKFMQTKCNTTIESYEPDSVNTSSNASFSQHRFLINKGSVALAGLNISFAVFDAWNFVNGDFLTYNVTVVGSSSYITRMRLFHIPPAASAATTIRFPEVLKTRHSDTVVYLSISDKNGKFLTSSSAAVRLLGFPDADYCLNHSCVSTWENGTQILNSIGETGCVKEEAERYFFDSKYGNCAGK